MLNFYRENRPWGYFEVLLDTPTYKVKRITLNPHQRLSLQRHKLRFEHWIIVEGEGTVTKNGIDYTLSRSMHVDISKEESHRIRNDGEGELVFIEVQMGEYFGEDDIERIEDDYGRIK